MRWLRNLPRAVADAREIEVLRAQLVAVAYANAQWQDAYWNAASVAATWEEQARRARDALQAERAQHAATLGAKEILESMLAAPLDEIPTTDAHTTTDRKDLR